LWLDTPRDKWIAAENKWIAAENKWIAAENKKRECSVATWSQILGCTYTYYVHCISICHMLW
jgi:hypothetical protein